MAQTKRFTAEIPRNVHQAITRFLIDEDMYQGEWLESVAYLRIPSHYFEKPCLTAKAKGRKDK